MIDIKILTIKDLLPISGVQYAQVVPRSLVIQGEDLTSATEVLVNDQPAPEFMVVSNHQIIAQVPSSEVNEIISKLVVLSEKPTTNRKSLISFSTGRTFKGIQGLERLIQVFVKLLLQTPGSDKFSPNDGGGLLRIVGNTFAKDNSRAIQASAVTAVNRTREQLISRQSKNSRIPSDEKLLTAAIDSLGFNPNITALSLSIFITAVSGRQAVANLIL